MAHGVRGDSSEKIKQVIVHFYSRAHLEAMRHEHLEIQWLTQTTDHPWLPCIKKHRTEKIQFLIRLDVDVYNDSLIGTLSAHSWPSRSLSQMHSDRLLADMASTDMSTPF